MTETQLNRGIEFLQYMLEENEHLREIIEQFCMDADNHVHAYWRPSTTNAIQTLRYD